MQIQPIGVPYDLHRHAFRMGLTPAALLPHLAALLPEAAPPVVVAAHNLSGEEIDDVGRIMRALADAVRAARAAGCLPLIIGGDCTTAIGAMAGLGQEVAGLVWIDAHGDFNTPAISPSGYLGGMPLAVVAGRTLEKLRLAAGQTEPLDESRIVLLGARDLDPLEQEALAASPIAVFDTEAVREGGPELDTALDQLAAGPIYLHLDVDVLDASQMPGVVYPTTGGLLLDELCELLHYVNIRCELACATLTAINLEPLDEAKQALVIGRALAILEDLLPS
jgi:arginase